MHVAALCDRHNRMPVILLSAWPRGRRRRCDRLRHQAAVEDVDYRAARGLDRMLFQALIAGRWIDEAQNLVIEGPAGVGSCTAAATATLSPGPEITLRVRSRAIAWAASSPPIAAARVKARTSASRQMSLPRRPWSNLAYELRLS
jgi:hypothetical protein